MPKRLTYELLIVGVLALGSCSRPPSIEERMDLAEANLGRAADASSALVDRVERLEKRVDQVESKLSM